MICEFKYGEHVFANPETMCVHIVNLRLSAEQLESQPVAQLLLMLGNELIVQTAVAKNINKQELVGLLAQAIARHKFKNKGE